MCADRSQDDEFPAITVAYVVARQAMKVGDHDRLPGELVPEAADWSVKGRDAMISQGWLEAVPITDASTRKKLARQWQREEATRAQLAAQRKEAEAQEPPPAPVPEGAVMLNCANCKKPRAFPELPGLRTIWECGACGQRQSVEQSRAGTLQMVAPHTINHNRMHSNWRPHYG